MRPIRSAHLYPKHLNLYGDRGNIIALERRARWRNLPWDEPVMVDPGHPIDFSAIDLLFIGGGQDQQQSLVARDLLGEKAGPLLREAANGLVILAVCGGFQLLCRRYCTAGGEEIKGVGLFDAETQAGTERLIGNVLADSVLPGVGKVVGFENHSGRTWLASGTEPFAHVLYGHGNNGQDGTEGAVCGYAVGTYLHGSLLPKNPQLTDWLLAMALKRQGIDQELLPIDDRIEEKARASAVERTRQTARRAQGDETGY